MSKSTWYDLNSVEPPQIDDEVYTDVGADEWALGDVARAFYGLVLCTAAAGGGTTLVLNTDYQLIVPTDQTYSRLMGFQVYYRVKIINAAYQTGDLYASYTCLGTYTSVALINALVTAATIAVPRVGKLDITQEERTLAADMPWYNLANPTATLAAANFVDYVPYLRAITAGPRWSSAVLSGTVTLAGTELTGSSTNFDPELAVGDLVFIEKLNQFRFIATRTSDTAATVDEPGTAAAGARMWKITRAASKTTTFPITSYQITGATSFSLWFNEGSTTKQPENYILMRALAEAYAYDREYGTLTLPDAIGGIPAGDYQITGVTLANVGSSSAVITCSATGLTPGAETASTANISIYPHRIAGSTTTARHKELTDAAIMNDGLYNVLGLAQRDYSLDHNHYSGVGIIQAYNQGVYGYITTDMPGSATNGRCLTDGYAAQRQNITSAMKQQGVYETPRTGPRTHPRSGIFNFYEYVGTYVA